MRFLPDRRLYTRTQQCLDWLIRESADPQRSPTRFERCHLYWYGDFSVKQAFAVMSFLATQDLDRTELWLWLDGANGYDGHRDNALLRPLLPFLQVRRFDPEEEARGTPLASSSALYQDVTPTERANVARFLALFKYGGIYVDMDTLLLRDLHCLPPYVDEFCYAWGALDPYGNNAVVGLRQESAAAHEILRRFVEKNSSRARAVLAYDEGEGLDLLVLPCVCFDPLWPHFEGADVYAAAPFDRFWEFFRRFGPGGFAPKPDRLSYRTFFPGAFAYHWHNRWSLPELADSYFGRLYMELEEILDERLGIRWPAGDLQPAAS